MADDSVDVVIIGAGIVGLHIAWKLCRQYPDWTIAVFEKEHFLGEHASGRNSGVLHAGIYYEKGSLKHEMCLQGNKIWYELGKKYNLPIKKCGKYILTTKEKESELQKLYQKGRDNGVELRWAKDEEVSLLNQHCFVSKAFFVPSTGIIDVSAILTFLRNEIEKCQGLIFLGNKVCKVCEVKNKSGHLFHIQTQNESFTTRYLINTAGLDAVAIRKQLGLTDVEPYWLKGHYLKTSQPVFNQSLIYPAPDNKNNALGVHSSFDFDGITRFGPDVNEVNNIDYSVSSDLDSSMVAAIEQLFKNIDPSLLSIDFAGIRSRIIYNSNEYNDFWIKGTRELGIDGYIELLGIDSPGLTAAPAIADKVAKLIEA